MMRWLGAVVLVVVASGGVTAQKPEGGAPAGDAMSPAQVNQLFDAMLVMQAQEELALGEQQYGQFLTRLKVLQETRRRNQQERTRLLNEMQRMTNPRNSRSSATEAEIKMRLSTLQELESRSAAELRKAYNGIDEVLSPLQQARFRVFEDEIERRKLQLIARARLNNPNRQTPPRRPPGR